MKHIFIILTFISTTAFAQDDEIAVKQAVNTLFDGMRKSDTAMIRSAFASQPELQTIIKNREGAISVESEMLDSFLLAISRPYAEIYDERINSIL